MLKRKVYLPKNTEINYIGLIIGPKGMYQKKLEEQTGCRILIRGKYDDNRITFENRGAKDNNPPLPDDDDEQHVLVILLVLFLRLLGKTKKMCKEPRLPSMALLMLMRKLETQFGRSS